MCEDYKTLVQYFISAFVLEHKVYVFLFTSLCFSLLCSSLFDMIALNFQIWMKHSTSCLRDGPIDSSGSANKLVSPLWDES